MNEKVSALIDAELDELDERRVLKAVKNDIELRRTWERYHVIRAAMVRQLGVLAPVDMPERVQARLGAEAPGSVVKSAAALRFWSLAGGFATAASVAVVAIIGLQVFRGSTVPITAIAPAAQIAAVAPVAPVEPVAALSRNGDQSAVDATAVPASTRASGPDERLNLYLVGHNEFMPTGGMGGMLPYVRVVADDPDQ